MGGSTSKHEQQFNSINRDVNSIRSSIRSSKNLNQNHRDSLVRKLVIDSQELSKLKGKVKDKKITGALQKISSTTTELLSPNLDDSQLDLASVETNSFVQVPVKKEDVVVVQEKPKAKNKIQITSNSSRRSLPTCGEIEAKLRNLKPFIVTAIENKDRKQLRVHKETIKVLATDLEMIPTQKASLLDERKEKLQNQLSACYQKIDRAYRDISRSSNIEYLINDEKKNKAWNELRDVEKELKLVLPQIQEEAKSSNSDNLHKIRDTLSRFGPRLNAIEVVDEQTQTKKNQLQEQNKQLAVFLEQSLHKENIKSAIRQVSEDTKMLHSDSSADCGKKLLTMKNFVEHLEEVDMDVKKLKTNLVEYIEQTLHTYEQQVQKEKEKLEEEKIKIQQENADVKNIKTLDDFMNYWLSLRTNFKIDTGSKEDLVKLDGLLEDLQMSVAEKRKSIGTIIEPPKPPVRYSSNFIRNAKMLSEIDAPVASKVTIVEKTLPVVNNVELPQLTTECLEEIRNIKAKFDFIKEKLSMYQGNADIQDKIQSYIKALTKYSKHTNRNVSSSATAVLNEINAALASSAIRRSNRSSKGNISRYSVEGTLVKITEISSLVELVGKQVDLMTGVESVDKSDKLTAELLMLKDRLEEIKVLPKYGMIQQSKDETMTIIDGYLKTLQGLLNLNNQPTYSESSLPKPPEENFQFDQFFETKLELNRLKEQVNRFTGGYKNVLYVGIESKLKRIYAKLASSNLNGAEEIANDIQKYLKILEQRSTKPQSFRHSKEILREYNLGQLESPESVNVVKIMSNAQEAPNNYNQANPDNILEQITNEVEGIKENVQFFVGLETDLTYTNLEETLIETTKKLDNIQVHNDDNLKKQKLHLIREIQYCSDRLDQTAKETKIITYIERELKHIGTQIDDLMNLTKEEREDLDEELIALQLRFGRLENFGYGLKDRANNCAQLIGKYLNRIRGNVEGTLV